MIERRAPSRLPTRRCDDARRDKRGPAGLRRWGGWGMSDRTRTLRSVQDRYRARSFGPVLTLGARCLPHLGRVFRFLFSFSFFVLRVLFRFS